jgi:hypothetical protein
MADRDDIEIRKQIAEALAILHAALVGAEELGKELKHREILTTAANEDLSHVSTYSLAEQLLDAVKPLKHAFAALGGTREEAMDASRKHIENVIAEGHAAILRDTPEEGSG